MPLDATTWNATPAQLSQGKFPHADSLSPRVFPCRHVLVRGVSLLGSVFAEALLGCTHLYSLLSTLSVLTPRGVIARPSGSSHSRRSEMGSITHFCEASTAHPEFNVSTICKMQPANAFEILEKLSAGWRNGSPRRWNNAFGNH